eukprot:gnl/MRDRNA2_/MRDRNA2_256305_c0_seq1.p1 gnl/MRDRNA2_/MRDRNA2_256305_c0~~gnl/MRDRNA2_/MRDRNA2_256305_c0_seq1.p1  ORF type:complete len:175 (+),score=35.86 gnl/MRDRNA2_/MRDRNA2_256305_c0_seq1:62-586(+)
MERMSAKLHDLAVPHHLSEESLQELAQVDGTADRAAMCRERRGMASDCCDRLCKSLNEMVQVIDAQPSKENKDTAKLYHSCFRDLQWLVNELQSLARAIEILENYDAQSSNAVTDYSRLSAKIALEHSRAYELLKKLNDDNSTERSGPLEHPFALGIISLAAVCIGVLPPLLLP